MTENRQKINLKEMDLLKKVIIRGIYSALEEAIAFCCRLFTE